MAATITMDAARLTELVADLRRFIELPAVAQECRGAGMPDGLYYRKACEALDELERVEVAHFRDAAARK
jgi:hypothetical protein